MSIKHLLKIVSEWKIIVRFILRVLQSFRECCSAYVALFDADAFLESIHLTDNP